MKKKLHIEKTEGELTLNISDVIKYLENFPLEEVLKDVPKDKRRKLIARALCSIHIEEQILEQIEYLKDGSKYPLD